MPEMASCASRVTGTGPVKTLPARPAYPWPVPDDTDLRAHLWGLEWDFLVLDRVGHVAVLSSAGYGPIPEQVLNARDDVERAIAAVDAMPVSTRARSVHTGDGDYSDWYAISDRGLFAYDWQVWHGPYRLIAEPELAVTVDALPSAIQRAAGLIRLAEDFAETAQLRLS